MKTAVLSTGFLLTLAAIGLLIHGVRPAAERTGSLKPSTVPSGVAEPMTAADRLVKQAERVIQIAPDSADGYNLLCAAYIKKARETGDFNLNMRAEAALNRSLELAAENSEAMRLRPVLLLTYHRFDEALAAAKRAQSRRPGDAMLYGAMTDALVELGRYEEAKAAAEAMLDLQPDAAAFCRIAYLNALSGDPAGALSAMRQADRYANPSDLETVAWVKVHLGDELLNVGKIAEADAQFDLALRALPGFHLALSGKARAQLRAAEFEGAIAYYRLAQARVPSPETVVTLGDLFMKTNRPEEAREQYELVEFLEQSNSSEAQTYSRNLAMYYANQNKNLTEALQIAQRERATRRDIYTCDALAWCRFRNGQFEDARQAITEAMRLGTRDAQIYYHAGMIYDALGNRVLASKFLRKALEINPVFDVLQADVARQTLIRLQGR